MNSPEDSRCRDTGSSRRRFLQAAATLSAVVSSTPASGQTAAKPNLLPQIRIGNRSLSRLLCGCNPFGGLSHLSKMIDDEMRMYYTREQIIKTLRHCQDLGINTWAAGTNFGDRAVHEAFPMQFIVNTSSEDRIALIPDFAKLGCIAVGHHGGPTDSLYKAGKLNQVREFCKKVRDTGVLVGVVSHRPAVFDTIESQGWDVDYYMCCMYQWGRSRAELEKMFPPDLLPTEATIKDANPEVFIESDPPKMLRFIQQTKKPCLAYKILGAGRKCEKPEQVEAAFKVAFENIKASDAVVVGMYDRLYDQATENAEYVRRFSSLSRA